MVNSFNMSFQVGFYLELFSTNLTIYVLNFFVYGVQMNSQSTLYCESSFADVANKWSYFQVHYSCMNSQCFWLDKCFFTSGAFMTSWCFMYLSYVIFEKMCICKFLITKITPGLRVMNVWRQSFKITLPGKLCQSVDLFGRIRFCFSLLYWRFLVILILPHT